MRWKSFRLVTLPAVIIGLCVGLALLSQRSQASLTQLIGSTLTEASFDNQPLNGVNLATPLVMLTLSRDHQLHYKAYNDYSDIDGDGVLETTYSHGIDYYGYFDSYVCYTYDTTLGRFKPALLKTKNTTLPDNDPANKTAKYCTAGNNQWSGNFLNWVSMTRMDAVRKLLYGGYRSIDSSTLTVLERDYLPGDAHAFAKYYNGSDINQLTPFSGGSGSLSPTASFPFDTQAKINAATASVTITKITRSASIETVTTSAAHPYATGEIVLIAGSDASYNGFRTITGTPTSTTFTFSVTSTASTSGVNGGTAQLALAVTTSANTPVAVGDQITLSYPTTSPTITIMGTVGVNQSATQNLYNSSVALQDSLNTGTAYILLSNIVATGTLSTAVTASSSQYNVSDDSNVGISFCNVTVAASGSADSTSAGVNDLSQTNTNPPLLRVARGNFAEWSANEQRQCRWFSEHNNTAGGYSFRSNGNIESKSGLGASAENPSQTVHGLTITGLLPAAEFNVRVEACVANYIGTQRCEKYPTSTLLKPIGLLQVYGEPGKINFGLMTTSYAKNISGGVLRKTISSMAAEINTATDGTFTSTQGIVYNLNKLRIFGYQYSSPGYGTADSCTARLAGIVHTGGVNTTGSSVNEGSCSNWGNPLSEVFLESLRYLAGKMKSPGAASTGYAYSTGSPDAALGLSLATADDPLSNNNYCANLNVIALEASVSSYDDDQMSQISDLGTSQTAKQLTNLVGDYEGITGKKFFVGNSDTGTDGQCTAKTINTLGDVKGVCPEAPNLSGTYQIAGAAYFAHTNRIRSDLTAVPTLANDSRSLKVNTYGIALATNTPQIIIPVPGSTTQKVTLLPAFSTHLVSGTGTQYAPGSIIDFKIISQDLVNGTGKFYVNWENSTQGSDYDQDLWGTISYAFSSDKTKILVTTQVVSFSAGSNMGFGYVINGTTQDGLHIHSGAQGTSGEASGFAYTDAANISVTPTTKVNASGGCNNCVYNDAATTATFSLGASTAQPLQSPLYYAAKYGGFDETFSPKASQNSKPDLVSEWDSHKADGSVGTDGQPDNYFFVSNPNGLEKSLDAAFRSILAKTGSGTAAAVVANARQGEGAVYQSIYVTSRADSKDNVATWIGTLHALFIDSYGNLREDGNGDGKLQENDYSTDPAVEIFFDTTDSTTKIARFKFSVVPGTSTTLASEIKPLDDLHTLWNARKQLSALTDVTTQRSYTSKADTGRYIFTYLDLNGDGAATSNEVKDFVPATFGVGTFGILNVPDATGASTLVNYIRGDESQNASKGLRNRTLDYDNNGTTEVMRLGDIVDSSPTEVGAPAEAFDLLYSDTTYGTFRSQYARRRNVVYVGANDGMLHAFNAGFYNPTTKAYELTGGKTEVQHPLGSELWAYVPYNLLSHLFWLASPNYDHVWYMDGKPRIFDARIFTPEASCSTTPLPASCVHPGGWGTVMVTGMRYGGGPISLTVTGNPTGFTSFTQAGLALTSLIHRSAYVVMDITNPEQAPTLLAEVTDPTGNLGFTTSYPTVASFSHLNNTTAPTDDKWYLIFGSGPITDLANLTTGLGTGGSMGAAFSVLTTQTAKLYVYDLASKSFVKNGTNNYFYDLGNNATTGAANSFVGDPVTVDWDLNFRANSIYFGTTGGTEAAPAGKLFKLDFNPTGAANAENATPSNWTAPVVLVNPGNPVIATPSVTKDEKGNHWVMAGTGRFFSRGDKSSSQAQSLFGVIDNLPVTAPTTGPDFSTLVDVTSAKVAAATSSTLGGTIQGVTGATTQDALITLVQTKKGWKRSLTNSTANPAERNVNQTALLGGTLFATGFTPGNTQCASEGNSNLYCMYYKTGAGNANLAACGTTPGTFGSSAVNVVTDKVLLGTGLGASPSLHLSGSGSSGDGKLTVITQTSTGAITQSETNANQTSRSGEVDWREVHN